MKKILLHSMVFITSILAAFAVHVNNLGSALPTAFNEKGISPSDTLIRLMDDSVAIGYLHNGKAYIDNLDTLHFVFSDEVDRSFYTLSNFKVEGPFGHYYLTASGNYSNKEIRIALPCFGDVPNVHHEFPRRFDNYINLCYGEQGSNCSFIKNDEQTIIAVSSVCKHAVSREGGADLYQKYILDYDKYPRYGAY